MGEERRKLAGLEKTWSQDTGDYSNDRLGRKECIVLLGKFFDRFLRLVELLERIHVEYVDVQRLSFRYVLSITKDCDLRNEVTISEPMTNDDTFFQNAAGTFGRHKKKRIKHVGKDGCRNFTTQPHHSKQAHLHLWPRDVRKLNGTRKTLILLGVIILQTNLQLNGLQKASLLCLRLLENLLDGGLDNCRWNFAGHGYRKESIAKGKKTEKLEDSQEGHNRTTQQRKQ